MERIREAVQLGEDLLEWVVTSSAYSEEKGKRGVVAHAAAERGCVLMGQDPLDI